MQSLQLIWRRRALLASFVRREISSRYAGTLVGALWALGQPVLMLLIYGFVFQRVLRVDFRDLGGHSFVAFLACGLWPWMAFQEGLQRATRSIVGNGALIKKVVFPYELLVLAAVAATFLVHFCGFLVVLGALWLLGPPFHPAGLPGMLGAWLVLALLAYGLALATASIQVVVRDMEHLIGPVLMLMFYLTPILYPRTLVPDAFRFVVDLNPIAHLLGVIRDGLLHGDVTPAWVLAPLFAFTLPVIWLGRRVFRRLAESFEDFM
jgi:lipopolysaccharide transport system permease protein